MRGVCATPGQVSVKGDILKVQAKDDSVVVFDGVEAVGPLLRCVVVDDPDFSA